MEVEGPLQGNQLTGWESSRVLLCWPFPKALPRLESAGPEVSRGLQDTFSAPPSPQVTPDFSDSGADFH